MIPLPGPWRTKVPSDGVFRAILFYFVTLGVLACLEDYLRWTPHYG